MLVFYKNCIKIRLKGSLINSNVKNAFYVVYFLVYFFFSPVLFSGKPPAGPKPPKSIALSFDVGPYGFRTFTFFEKDVFVDF